MLIYSFFFFFFKENNNSLVKTSITDGKGLREQDEREREREKKFKRFILFLFSTAGKYRGRSRTIRNPFPFLFFFKNSIFIIFLGQETFAFLMSVNTSRDQHIFETVPISPKTGLMTGLLALSSCYNCTSVDKLNHLSKWSRKCM